MGIPWEINFSLEENFGSAQNDRVLKAKISCPTQITITSLQSNIRFERFQNVLLGRNPFPMGFPWESHGKSEISRSIL